MTMIYRVSKMNLQGESYRVLKTEKELKLKEIENKLAYKNMPDVFRDSLEGRTISIDPVDIVIDESIPKSKYP